MVHHPRTAGPSDDPPRLLALPRAPLSIIRTRLLRPVAAGLSLAGLAGLMGIAGCGSTPGASPAPVLPSTSSTAATTSTTTGSATAGTNAATATQATSQPTATPAPPTPHATESNPPGDIPDNQAFVRYTPPGAAFSVKVPEGWARTAGAPGSTATSFTDKLNRIEITSVAAASAPSPASVRSADLPRLQASVPRFAPGQVTAATRSGSPVILITYQGDSAPNPVTGKVVRDAFERYIFYRAGTRVDLTLIGPNTADNVDPWRIVSDSLKWT